MGANQQTSVPAFTAGQVLTAQQQTEINTGIPVFADSTARTAAFGGTGEKVLAEGQYSYLEDTNSTEVYDGSGWVAVGASLSLITTGTLSAAASVTVDNCFTSTYDEYVLLVDVTGSTTASLTLQMRSAASTITATNYQWFRTGYTNGGATDNSSAITQSSWLFGYLGNIPSVFAVNIYGPLDNNNQHHSAFGVSYNAANTAAAVYSTGLRYGANQAFDGFVLAASTGTMTGTIRVYGYKK